ncbi:MAG: flagellar filament outer layer protein FlaA [Spirochaetota bacterium]
MKKLLTGIAVLFLSFALLSQDAPDEQEDVQEERQEEAQTQAQDVEDDEDFNLGDQIYQEVILEDFESREYPSSLVSIRVTKDQKAAIAIRDVFPAPVRNSEKYLGVKVYGRHGDYLTINFPEKLEISKHCQSISMWVYGKNFAGELSLILQDAENQVHRLSFGKLNFLGWRKLTVKLNKNIRQEDKYLAQPRSLKILKMVYNPSSEKRLPTWNYFYIDNISAKVREKYQDRQSDAW